ncbi:MAG: tryptophan synthase subunit alpha [Streptosporangiaceae bacterium]
MNRAGGAFERAAEQGRAAVVGYLPAGFPTVAGGIEAALAMARSGADIIEIGLPYSDPVVDGPVIQEAVHRALTGGVRVHDVLRTVEAVAGSGVPVLVMTYWNPVEQHGVEAFAADLAAAGGAGLITPDLTPEEAGPWLAAAAAHDLDAVFLAAISSSPERIERIASACRGFVYAVSVMSVTGVREMVESEAAALVARIKKVTSLPVGVGVGVRNGTQAASVASFADGVIVGTAFVRRLLEAPTQEAGVAAVADLAAELASAVRSPAATPIP